MLLVLDFKPPIHPPLVGFLDPTTGFDVRKRYSNVSPFDGKVTSCRFVCSNEGLRRKGQTNRATKCFRAETKTDCKARISLILDRIAGNYEVNDVVLEHNHLLHLPETRHLMASQRKISELQAFEIGLQMILELDQKLHMSWLVVKLVDHLTLATLAVIAKIICKANDRGIWLSDKLEVC